MRIGLTGGIGSGKSTVAAYLRERGYCVLDADDFSRKVTEPGAPALIELRERFGAEIFASNGELERKKLGAIVFADKEARRDAEAILHRRIAEAMLDAERLASSDPVFWEVPLLFESGWDSQMDEVWLVDAEDEQRIHRVMERDEFTREEVICRIKSQMPREEKIRKADRIIANRGDLESLSLQTEELLQSVKRKESLL